MQLIDVRRLLRRTRLAALLPALLAALMVAALAAPHAGIGAPARAPHAQGAEPAQAEAVAPLITYQGRLLNPGTGAPLNGSFTFTFRLYGTATGGAALWTETKDITVANGLFNTLLGDVTPLPAAIFNGQNLWLGVKVGADAEATPRQRMAPTAYALFAADADRLDGLDGGAFVKTGGGTLAATASGPVLTVDQAGSGVAGLFTSAQGDAVRGENAAHGGSALVGYATATTGTNYGVYGQSDSASGGAGVRGQGPYVGVWGSATSTTGVNWGVYGATSSPGGYAGYFSASGGGTAARFVGSVSVAGTLSKSAGSFKIDHPLDPENKYLSHSFVESPDMLNVYNGNVTLGADGTAWVDLPAYFEALNRDFHYQLTAIGGPGPNLHVAQEVAGNRFRIAGGTPGLRVSWQVTGSRHDAYAQAHPIVVEEEKPAAERGTLLHPEVFGRAASAGLDARLHAMPQEGGAE